MNLLTLLADLQQRCMARFPGKELSSAFNFIKWHTSRHVIETIRLWGRPRNWSTEMFEALHVALKQLIHRTNFKDFATQILARAKRLLLAQRILPMLLGRSAAQHPHAAPASSAATAGAAVHDVLLRGRVGALQAADQQDEAASTFLSLPMIAAIDAAMAACCAERGLPACNVQSAVQYGGVRLMDGDVPVYSIVHAADSTGVLLLEPTPISAVGAGGVRGARISSVVGITDARGDSTSIAYPIAFFSPHPWQRRRVLPVQGPSRLWPTVTFGSPRPTAP